MSKKKNSDNVMDEVEGLRYVANRVMAAYKYRLAKSRRERSASSKKKQEDPNPYIRCPICKSKMRVSEYINHWKEEHRHQSADTAAERRRVEKLYRWSIAVGGRGNTPIFN